MSAVWIDGQFYDRDQASISVFDHGLLYGDGVFEGVRAYGGRVFRLEQHIQRLYHSAKAIWLDVPMSRAMSRLYPASPSRPRLPIPSGARQASPN